MNPHDEIESVFFEFRKMKAFLEMGVTVRVVDVPHAPFPLAQDYMNSILLVDLVSVLDMAVNHFFNYFKLTKSEDDKRSRLTIMADNGFIANPGNLKWYRDLRHKTAHALRRHEWHMLDQATNEVCEQFTKWGLTSGTLNFKHLYYRTETGATRIGSRIDQTPVLEYEAQSHQVASGFSASTSQITDLTFRQYMDLQANLHTKD